MDKDRLSSRSLRNLVGVHPDLVRIIEESIKRSPVDFVVTEGVRSERRQQELYKEGKSRCDGVRKKSKHQKRSDGYGYAVDVYPLPIDYSKKEPYISLSKHIKRTAREKK